MSGGSRNPAWALSVALLAALAACGSGAAPPAEEEGRESIEVPSAEPVADVVDPVAPEVRRACATVSTYWSAVPAAAIRNLDSTVTAPGPGGVRDACLVEVVLDQDPDREDRERVRAPFVAAGWYEVYEFRAEAPGERSRVYQNDPIRCRVTERWDVPRGDTAAVPAPWFRQLTACWRRTPMG